MTEHRNWLDEISKPAPPPEPETEGRVGAGRRGRQGKAQGDRETQERTGRRKPRWWGVLCGFVGNHLATVPPAAGVAWLVLFRNSHEGKVRMSVDQIAAATGLSRRHAIRAVNSLVDAGLVKRLVRGCRNSGTTIYRLLPTGEDGSKGDTDGTFTDRSKRDTRGTLKGDTRGTLSKREQGDALPAGAVAVAPNRRPERRDVATLRHVGGAA